MRITEQDLKNRVHRLNRIAGFLDGVEYTTVGSYQIDWAYGKVNLVKITSEGGCCESVFNCGFIPKRELFERICAFMDGIEAAKDFYKGERI